MRKVIVFVFFTKKKSIGKYSIVFSLFQLYREKSVGARILLFFCLAISDLIIDVSSTTGLKKAVPPMNTRAEGQFVYDIFHF